MRRLNSNEKLIFTLTKFLIGLIVVLLFLFFILKLILDNYNKKKKITQITTIKPETQIDLANNLNKLKNTNIFLYGKIKNLVDEYKKYGIDIKTTKTNLNKLAQEYNNLGIEFNANNLTLVELIEKLRLLGIELSFIGDGLPGDMLNERGGYKITLSDGSNMYLPYTLLGNSRPYTRDENTGAIVYDPKKQEIISKLLNPRGEVGRSPFRLPGGFNDIKKFTDWLNKYGPKNT